MAVIMTGRRELKRFGTGGACWKKQPMKIKLLAGRQVVRAALAHTDLDGGGANGFKTLGVLAEIEASADQLLGT